MPARLWLPDAPEKEDGLAGNGVRRREPTNMKKKLTLLTIALALAVSPFIFAQSADPQIERLAKAVALIERINRMPVDFRAVMAGGEITEAVSEEGLANLRQIAALLNELRAGTTVEIGAHTFPLEETIFEAGGPATELALTGRRAELARRELVRLGVRVTLKAKGYGATKPLVSNATNAGMLKNQRLEFLIEKLPDLAAAETAAGGENAIVAGRGWRRVILGAPRREVEAVLGPPEKFYAGNLLLPDPSSHYFARGLIVVYDAANETVKSVSFVGDPSRLNAGDYAGVFRRTEAAPDQRLSWGATEARIVAAYGAPKNRFVARNGNAVVTLTYEEIAFTLEADRLYLISVADHRRFIETANREQAKKAAPVVPTTPPVAYEARYTIIADQGAGPLRLGATRSAIEAAFGRPDEFQDEKVGIFQIYQANYYAQGVEVEYDPSTNAATKILLFGVTGEGGAFAKYRLFPGATDRGVRWGASPADVMRAYGKPVEERLRYNPNIDRDYEFITYPNVAFGFRENRLYYISIDPVWGRAKN